MNSFEKLPRLIGAHHAEVLGLSKYQFRKLFHIKGAPTVKWGSKIYLDRDRLFEFLEKQAKGERE
jgi:hypothetical protein